jgi:hypothetical protein
MFPGEDCACSQGKTARDREAGADVAKGPEPGLLGTVGLVTVAIPAAGPGEVLLPVRGGTETFAAWADEPIARHTRIMVVDTMPARSVLVMRA